MALKPGAFTSTTTAQLRAAYDASNYTDFTTGATGDFTIAPVGGDTAVTGTLAVTGTSVLTGAVTATGGVVGNLTGDITGTAPAGTLTGATLASNVLASSLTSVGTLTSLVATTADINGGTVDGATVGASSASSGAFTTLAASSTLAVTGATTLSSTLAVTDTITSTQAANSGVYASDFYNTTSGTAGAVFSKWTAGTTAVTLRAHSQGWTSTGPYIASGSLLVCSGAGGFGIYAFQGPFTVYGSGGIANFTVALSGAATLSSNLAVTGALSKGSGSFKIDHPLPAKKDTHHLVHSFVEGPRADLIYRGVAALSKGSATVDLDAAADMTSGTWELLCRDPQVWIQNDSGWAQVRGSVAGSTLTIACEDAASTDSVSWMVVAERCDPHIIETDWTDENGRVIVEPEKEVVVEAPAATVE